MLSLGRTRTELPGGLQIGPYVIESLLGAGGMGEVYRARDERLDRPVAVKILPAAFASDPDRMRRFEFEARATGSLSHPNILVVHDVGRYKERPFIVEELLEGATLRDRLRGRFLSPQRAVEIARQIADGLAAAHAKGIIHRDLKPSNVFLSQGGPVKILDFGLAKLRDPQTLDGEPDTGSTAGVLGTVGYLSPEQARGDHADSQADIFGLGCVLYEMLTGRKAFPGTSAAEVLAATLTMDPPSLSRTVPDVPSSLSRVVHRCMEKEPADRFSSAHDLSLALESTQEDLARPRLWRPRLHLGRRIRQVASLALIALVVAATGLWLQSFWRRDRLPEFAPRQLTSGAGLEAHPAISPDGREVAYAATQDGNTDIWIVGVQGGTPLRLTDHEAADESPAWFPDGSSLAFVSHRGGQEAVWRVDRLGGKPTLLVPHARDPAVSPDGEQIAFTRSGEGGYHRIAVASLGALDDVRILTDGDHGLWNHKRPAWSPDGRTLCYEDVDSLWLVDVAKGTPRQLPTGGGARVQPAWSPDGRLLYFQSIREGIVAIWRAPVEGGPPERVTMGVGAEHSPSLSRDGRWLAYATAVEQEAIVAIDTTTGRRDRFEEVRRIGSPAVTPDGRAVIFVSDRDDKVNLWTLPLGMDPLTGAPRRITDHTGKCAWPDISSDGRWIAYYRAIDGQRDVWVLPAAGGPSLRFTDHPATDVHPAWSPDGSRIAFVSDRDGTLQIWMAEAVDGRRSGDAHQVTRGPVPVRRLAWSPDGLQLAYVAPVGGIDEVWMTPVDGSERHRQLTHGADARYLRWPRGTGRLLVSGSWGGSSMTLRVLDPATGETSPVPTAARSGRTPQIGGFDVSPDERWLVLLEREPRGDVWLLEARKGSF